MTAYSKCGRVARVRVAVLAAALAGASALPLGAAEPVQVLFPYTIVGRVVDAENKAFDASSDVALKVCDASSGTVLAQSKVYTPATACAYNFRLGVPVASAHVNGYAVKGDTLTLSATYADTVYTGLLKGDNATIGEAGASVSVRIMLADDANGNGIADIYEDSVYGAMQSYGIEGEFDPAADYDGDGQTNAAEYLAGTDPFDADDKLGVDTAESDDAYIKITFAAVQGRSYGIRETSDLGAGNTEWSRGRFKSDPTSAATQTWTPAPRDEWETRTIYLLKNGPSRFYRLEVAE